MSALFLDYKRNAKAGETFPAYLARIGFVDPSVNVNGMDDKVLAQPVGSDGLELIEVPKHKVTGNVQVIVLLVDFPDKLGTYGKEHYEDLFFSKKLHPTGSVRDYYGEVSNGLVDVTGSVHGWIRMPRPYGDYVGSDSGMAEGEHPNNCQGLAEDAAKAAKAAGVPFPAALDVLGRRFVTGFIIIHSGMAAELFQSVEEQRKEIWSHKWNLITPVKVGPNLQVTTYLTVAQNCKLGVCAHEIGHLLFQWQDFYDPNYDDDGELWQGSGDWDLMASGSYNYGSTIPAHPAGLHKMQHEWVATLEVKKTTKGVKLPPTTAVGGRVCKISSPAFAQDQFLLLESRPRVGFDKYLPGEGLLVWRVDLAKEMYAPATPGMQLVQADGDQHLESPDSRSQGDDSDPFPGSSAVTIVSDTLTEPSTSFPGKRSGVRLSNIVFDSKGVATFDVTITYATPVKVAGKVAGKAVKKAAPKTPKPTRSKRVSTGKPALRSAANVEAEPNGLKPKLSPHAPKARLSAFVKKTAR